MLDVYVRPNGLDYWQHEDTVDLRYLAVTVENARDEHGSDVEIVVKRAGNGPAIHRGAW